MTTFALVSLVVTAALFLAGWASVHADYRTQSEQRFGRRYHLWFWSLLLVFFQAYMAGCLRCCACDQNGRRSVAALVREATPSRAQVFACNPKVGAACGEVCRLRSP